MPGILQPRLPQRIAALLSMFGGRSRGQWRGQWRGLRVGLEDVQLAVSAGVGGLQAELENCPGL